MTLELFSTSVPSGLEPGRSGFCTVAMTRNLSRPLAEALESLSAYRPVFLPTDPRADDNPVAVSYLRVPVAGRNYHVVSRIGFAGLDYTSRSNRFAHHVVLDSNDPRPPGGPAWLAARPGFLETAFDGKIQYLPAGRAVPVALATSAACPTWQRLTGNAGWAGVVAEALANPSARSFFLVYDLGTNLLPLLQEAIGLLPPERRWEATFTTYFTGLPAGVGCTVRGVLRGSAEAAAVHGASSLDLGKLAGKTPPVNEWTAAARAGKAVATRHVTVNAPLPAKMGTPPSPSQLAEPQPLPFAHIGEANAFGFDEGPQLVRDSKPGGVGKWIVLTVLASLVFLGGGAGAVVLLRPDLFRRHHRVVEIPDEKDKGTLVEDKSKAGKGSDKENPKPQGKFEASKAELMVDRPVAGKATIVRVGLDFPKDAPTFPLDKLRFTLDGKEFPAKRQGDGFEVTFPKPGAGKIIAEYAGGERFEKFSIPLSIKVLAPLPAFTVQATPTQAKRGDKIEVSIKVNPRGYTAVGFLAGVACANELPKGFPAFGLIGLTGQGSGAKITPSPDGKKPIVLEGLKPGKYRIRAKFPGNDTFAAGESSNTVEVRVQRKPVFAFEPPNRDAVSRGKIALNVTVKGSDKDDPIPKGTLQLLSNDEILAERTIKDKGIVSLEKEGLSPKTYELKLRFTPDDKEAWPVVEMPIPGPWQVIPTVEVKVDLEEEKIWKDSKSRVRFKVVSNGGGDNVRELPLGKLFFLQFRPSRQAVKGAFESDPVLELSDTDNPMLVVRWKPGEDSWGMAKSIEDTGYFNVITVIVTDRIERSARKQVKYALYNFFPPSPPKGKSDAYLPLVPAYRNVVKSLHLAEIEVYEGMDKKETVKDAKGKETEKTVRVKKDPKALPLLRLKLLDQR